MKRNYFKLGDYNIICDRTGFKVKASRAKRTWDNLFVRGQSWEKRHPQDFLHTVEDNQSVPIARTESTDVFLNTNEITADDL